MMTAPTNPTLYLYPVNIGLVNKIFERIIVNSISPISFYISFGCSKEPSQ